MDQHIRRASQLMATGVDTRDILNRWLKPLEE